MVQLFADWFPLRLLLLLLRLLHVYLLFSSRQFLLLLHVAHLPCHSSNGFL